VKRTIFFCLLLSVVVNVYGQSDTSFEPGVEILQEDSSFIVANNSRILFIFKDDLHLVNFYKDLEKKLKKQFKKSSLKIGFEYKLDARNPLSSDLKSLPKKKLDKAKFEYFITVSISDIKGWDNDTIEKRKQQFLISLGLRANSSEDEFASVQIQVNTYNTLLTQNIKVGEVIFASITK